MVDQVMVDLALDGHVSVHASLNGQPSGIPTPDASSFSWPLSQDDHEGLRWYLEDYLSVPFAVYEERGAELASGLATWGEAIFDVLFGSSVARNAYELVRTSTARTELIIRSSSPALLGLPWELLVDPVRRKPLALDGLGPVRSVPSEASGQPTIDVDLAGDRLRVLLVICRPMGASDVAFRMIGRHMLESLQAVRGRVEVILLRPPTFDALGVVLQEAVDRGEPFHVLHFDGHGRMHPEATLLFDKGGGASDPVSAANFAEVVTAAQVPLVVLNACHSGALSMPELDGTVATKLLARGTASVVAMGYTILAVAAREFMAAFYDSLFAGDAVTEAVSAGRKSMYRKPHRPSSKGMLPLADWLVPVHYRRADVRFSMLLADGKREVILDKASETHHGLLESSGDDSGDGLDPEGPFLGRDEFFYELEVATRLNRVVLLHGPGGTGKTELAKAFGRWWRDTAGVERPEFVIVHSFKPGAARFGIDSVVSAIGSRVFGNDFFQHDPPERHSIVEQLLDDHRLLLIWDNFESVFEMPDLNGATPPLSEDERRKVTSFLGRRSRGASVVLITSRTEERWLGDVLRMEVGGLAQNDAVEYADILLEPYPRAGPRRTAKVFAELLEWLDGHPLSMRVVLPHLEISEPEQLLADLRDSGKLHGASLAACIAYSFAHLHPDTGRLLMAVSLFQGVVDADILADLSRATSVPDRFRDVAKEGWITALATAARVGLLTEIGVGTYRIHPALPAYLLDRWRSEEPERHTDERAAAMTALVASYANFSEGLYREIRSGYAADALARIAMHTRMLSRLLGYALDSLRWADALAIAQTLDYYWDARGLFEEARDWVNRARVTLESPEGVPPSLDAPDGRLWLFLVGSEANRQLHAGLPDAAETIYLEMEAALTHVPESEAQQRTQGRIYHGLGWVAQSRYRFVDAERWYRRSLAIKEKLQDEEGIANTYMQLGIIIQESVRLGEADSDRLGEAEEFYRRSLAIDQKRKDQPAMAKSYEALGIVAQARAEPGTSTYEARLKDAEIWYSQALAIMQEHRDRPGMARLYYHLGSLNQERGHFAKAKQWYGKSLSIEEDLGNRPGIAISYWQFGELAEVSDQQREAEQWYSRSLAIDDELHNWPAVAETLAKLASLAHARGDAVNALERAVRCVALRDVVPNAIIDNGLRLLGDLVSELGVDIVSEQWQSTAGQPLPFAIRDFVENLGGGRDV